MSFIDSRGLPDGEIIERDLCIIGSGPAGIALAREFVGHSFTVALIESGGLDLDEEVQSLGKGEIVGLPYRDLSRARVRTFGGTTWHWGGNVRPLEPIDFTTRDWIKDSGWAITATDMAPYYVRARDFFKLPEIAFDEDYWRQSRGDPWQFKNSEVVSQIFHTVGKRGLRSADTWGETLKNARNIDLFYHATIVRIIADGPVKQIIEIIAQTANAKHVRFRGRMFVLAAGGIENPRLLLLSSDQQKDGLGNDYGLVGRYFQEHPHIYNFAKLLPKDLNLHFGFYGRFRRDWGSTWGVLRLSDEQMRRYSLPNVRFQLLNVVGMKSLTDECDTNTEREGWQPPEHLIDLIRGENKKELDQHIANVISDIHYAADTAYGPLMNQPVDGLAALQLLYVSEQTPNPDSRVRLSDKLDYYDQRQAVLDWRFQEADYRGARETAQALAQSFINSSMGRLSDKHIQSMFEVRADNRKWAEEPQILPMYHHMGTTRMHEDPRHGVVDANCRVHRLENFFIAGSSIFPTSGNANPTFTIVALSMRLADHLKDRFAA